MKHSVKSHMFLLVLFILFMFGLVCGNDIKVTVNEFSNQIRYDKFFTEYLTVLRNETKDEAIINDLLDLYNNDASPAEIAEKFFEAGKLSYDNDDYRNSELLFYGALYLYIRIYDGKQIAHTLTYLGTLMLNQGKYESSMQ